MELTLKKEYDLSSNAQKYQVVLDTISLLGEEENFTTAGITTIAMISIAANACNEDVIDLYNNSKMSSVDFSKKIIEPFINDLLKDNKEYLYDIVDDVYNYKEREIEISGKFIFAFKKVLRELSQSDTNVISDIILSAAALKDSATKEKAVAAEEAKKEQIAEVNDKLQDLVNKFIKENNNKDNESA